jgi:hypothetical protein
VSISVGAGIGRTSLNNVNRYAAQVYVDSPEAQAYVELKAELAKHIMAGSSLDIIVMLRQELDMAAEACEDAYRVARAEAREHYD